MYKPSNYLVITYFPTYLPKYETYFFTELVTKMKSDITIVEVHPQLSNKGHPVDGVLVGAGSLGPPIRKKKKTCIVVAKFQGNIYFSGNRHI
jgi:hypothetical protein